MRARDAVAEEVPRRRTLGKLDRLYADHAASATRLAYLITGDRYLAENLVQEAFVRVFGRFAHIRDRETFRAYLNRTIVNLSRDHFRKRKVEADHLARERGRVQRDTVLPNIEERHRLIDALDALPSRQRAAVVLRHHEDLSERQVAETLGCSLGAAKALIARGMETLRTTLEGDAT